MPRIELYPSAIATQSGKWVRARYVAEPTKSIAARNADWGIIGAARETMMARRAKSFLWLTRPSHEGRKYIQ